MMSTSHRQGFPKLVSRRLSGLPPEVFPGPAATNSARRKSTAVKSHSELSPDVIPRPAGINLGHRKSCAVKSHSKLSPEVIPRPAAIKLGRRKSCAVKSHSELSPEVIPRPAAINSRRRKSCAVKSHSEIPPDVIPGPAAINLNRRKSCAVKSHSEFPPEVIPRPAATNEAQRKSNRVKPHTELSPQVISRPANIGATTGKKSAAVKSGLSPDSSRPNTRLKSTRTRPAAVGRVARKKSSAGNSISGVQTVRRKKKLERIVALKLERLSSTVLQMYQSRTKENEVYTFFDKIKGNKRKLSNGSSSEEPRPKKSKKNKPVPDEYVVEKILKCKFEKGRELFFIKWKGWSNSDNTWEPIENLNCPEVIKEFLTRMENENCEKFELLKEELSFEDLLSDDNLVKRLREVEPSDLRKLKETLILKLLSIMNLKVEEESNATVLIQDTRNVLQMYVLTRKRCQQIMEMKLWEDHMNEVDSSKKLCVENYADLEFPPNDFSYIEHSVPGIGVTIPDDPPIGCDCVACNCKSKSCCGMQASSFAYKKNKLLRLAPGIPIYECNKTCKCSDNCNNRVVQNGRTVKLTIFRTLTGCGWGVRTEQRIRKGQFVCEYVGEVITWDEAEKRGKVYDANGMTYLFDLDFNHVEEPYVVDAASMGNVSHFINHSCDPNLGVWAVWANCLDPNLPMLALFATRDIEVGEEINFDYMHKHSDNEGADATSRSVGCSSDLDAPSTSNTNVSEDGRASPASIISRNTDVSANSPRKSRTEGNSVRVRTECKCGAVKCRNYLF